MLILPQKFSRLSLKPLASPIQFNSEVFWTAWHCIIFSLGKLVSKIKNETIIHKINKL